MLRNFELQPAGGPFHDPALLIQAKNMRSFILFDCGTLFGLKTRDLLKVRWLFLSHLHIDHLIGFDHLLRVRLFSDLPLRVAGPPGTCDAVYHRLQSYAWNLTSGSPFVIEAFELGEGGITKARLFPCHDQFRPHQTPPELPLVSANTLFLKRELGLTWHPVEHGVPCYCYRLERSFSPKFSLTASESLGLSPGPWIKRLADGESVELEVNGMVRDSPWLAERLLTSVPPESIGFLTDTALNQALAQKLAVFFQGVDTLVSECAYLERDRELAEQNLHMTTTQVASLAKDCRCQELLLFHLSRRYQESGSENHLEETRAIFPSTHLLNIDDL